MIYRKHFFNYAKTALVFFLLILISTFIHLGLFTSYQNNQASLTNLYSLISPAQLEFLNITDLSFTNIFYYYALYFNFGQILYLLLAITLAVKTMKSDSIYTKIFITKPINKRSYLKRKIALALLCLFATNILMFLILLIYFSFWNLEHVFITILLLTLASMAAELTIYALVLGISAFLNKTNVIALLVALIIIFFIILSVIYQITDLKILAYLDPLCYFNLIDIISERNLELDYLASMVIITTFGINLALCEYERDYLGGENV